MAIVVVSLISLVAATFVGLRSGQNLTRELIDERLVALANSGATDVAGQIAGLERVSQTLASSPAAARAVTEFSDAFDELRQVPIEQAQSGVDDLVAHYREKYIEPIAAAGSSVDLRDVIADDNAAALELQKAYSVPSEEIPDVTQVDDADDGSAWSAVHRDVHPTYRDVVERQRLVDVLLVEPTRGYVVYSYAKNADLGTSLQTGPFGGSVVSFAVAAALRDPTGGPVLTDFATYTPNVLTPVGAMVNPILDDDDEVVGAMVLVFDSEPITDLLTVGGDWDESGFPETAETFLIGGDGLMRSEPRSFLEDRAAHLEAAEGTGAIDEDERRQIAVAGSTVLVEEAVDDTVNSAVEGDTDLEERSNVTGNASFNQTERVPVDAVDWYVVAEVERGIADGDLDTFAQWLIVGAAVFVVIVAFAAVSWSDRVLRPVRATSELLRSWDGERIDPGGLDTADDSPTELRELVESFDSMLNSLEGQRDELSDARRRREQMLESLLPPQVAARVMAGDLEAVEDVAKVTVAVVVVTGLGELVQRGHGSTNHALVDRLHGELDELGERHGLERIKVVGDSYYAACGHHRPYIDHAPRVLAFVADARDAVREIGTESGHDLDVVAGVDTGPVHVGITRATGLVYDVWGPPVTAAHNLSRLGRRGQLLVTEASRTLLPETVECESASDVPDAYLVEPTSIGGAV